MKLDKIRNIFPDFQMENFNIFDTITLFNWETVFDYELWKEHKNLLLTMTSTNGYQIQIEFIDVDSLRFQGNGQISGFYIKNMSARGYENSSKYEVGDYENDEIEFYCSDVIIKRFEKIEQ